MELAYRDVAWQHPDNAANIGNVSQSTFAAFASYRFAESWTTAIRYEHLQGREAGAELHLGDIEYAFDSEKRDRISLALTRSFDLGENDSFLRLQYSTTSSLVNRPTQFFSNLASILAPEKFVKIFGNKLPLVKSPFLCLPPYCTEEIFLWAKNQLK